MSLLLVPSRITTGVAIPTLMVAWDVFFTPFVMLMLLELAPFCRRYWMPPCEEHEPLHVSPLAGTIDNVPGELLKFTRPPVTFTTELPPMKRAAPALMSSLPPLRI